MPRILHCIDTTGPGGAETVFVSLAERFSHAPYESSAVIRGPGWVRQQLEQRGIPLAQIDSKGSLNLRFLRALVHEIRSLRADIVHAHLLGANVYCAMAGGLTGVPVISTFHGSVDISPNERLSSIKFAIVRRLSTVVAVSETLRDEVAARLSIPPTQVRLIPNGIDCDRFAAASPLGLRAEHGIADGAVLIGSLGNIRPAKAYPVGVRALRLLRKRGIDAHWLIAGQSRPEDSLMDQLQALVQELDVVPYVHFLGFVDRPEGFLSEIDCFLLCSDSEGHPLALTQAMAAGKAIVATRCGVENFLEQNDACAWLVPVNAPDQLARAMQSATSDIGERRARGRNAQAYARRHFDNAAVFDNYGQLYGEVLATRWRPRPTD
jgi:glycosyltransferase involved in cell wall biosynthesis